MQCRNAGPHTYKLDYNIDFFKKRCANYYYFLGAALTDGCISKQGGNNLRFTLTSKDADWIESLYNFSGGNTVERERTTYLTINHPYIVNRLLRDGCTPRKSLTLQLPKIPKKYFFDFLRGCTDGDGSIGFYTSKKKHDNGNIYLERRPTWYLCSSSLHFLKAIKETLLATGIDLFISQAHKPGESHIINTTTQRVITTTVPGYRLCAGNRKAFILLKALGYDNINKPAMLRKRAIAINIIDHYEGDGFKKRRNTYDFSSKENYYDRSNEEFIEAVNKSCNIAELLRNLGLAKTNKYAKQRMKELNLVFT